MNRNKLSKCSPILLISRLPDHGPFLNKLLSAYYQVFWIGRSFSNSLSIFNILFVVLREFISSLIIINKYRCKLFLVQFISIDGIIGVFFKKVFRTKLVLFAVGSDILKIERYGFFYPIVKVIINQSDSILCASGQIEKRLVSMGFNESKITVIPSIVDINNVKEYSGPKIYDIINIGSLDSNKNQMLLLKACALLSPSNILIIGEGPMRLPLESEARKNHLNITFTGRIPHEIVLEKLQKSRIYVHVSKSEGLPVSILEAMFFELPVVVTKSPYVSEIQHRYDLKLNVTCENSAESLAKELYRVAQTCDEQKNNQLLNKKAVERLNNTAIDTIKNILFNLETQNDFN